MEDNRLSLEPGQRLEQRGNRFIIVNENGRLIDLEGSLKPKNKYRNNKIEVRGMKFDSVKESERYAELMLMQKHGLISDLQRQVKFVLIPSQREPDTTGPHGGVIKGKLIESECAYYADFTYKDSDGHLVVEDVKSEFTKKDKVFCIKRKLMLYVYGITIQIYN